MINYWKALDWITELRQEVLTLQYRNRQLRERLQEVRRTLHKRNKQIRGIHRISSPEVDPDAL